MTKYRLPFYQDKLHEETVFRRFTEILTKARANKNSNKPETELKEFETASIRSLFRVIFALNLHPTYRLF